MSERIKSSWTVLISIEDSNHDFCLDVFQREDDTFGFESFRRDPEDLGRWQPLSHYSILAFTEYESALEDAYHRLEWLRLEYATVQQLIQTLADTTEK